jgi:regulator of sirC expression with transglutaminase-like and TPR domain
LEARALARLQRHEEAVEALRRAVKIDPLTPVVHLELGFAATRTGAFTVARGAFEHFLRLSPTAPEAARARASIETLTRLLNLLEAHADA